MRITKIVLISFVLAISSAFFIGMFPGGITIETAEACGKPGYYYDISTKNCKPGEKRGDDYVSDLGEKNNTVDLIDSITKIVNTVVAILLAFGVISIIYSGLQLSLSALNERQAELAKKRLLNTFIGIVFLMSVFSIYKILFRIFILTERWTTKDNLETTIQFINSFKFLF